MKMSIFKCFMFFNGPYGTFFRKRAAILLLLLSASNLFSETLLNREEAFYSLSARADMGFVSVLKHTYQNGDSGTNFDYRNQGGQDILFPFTRYELGIRVKRNFFYLLYQPLEVVTNVNFYEDVIIDDKTFAAGSPMKLTYSFPFWRATWIYNFSPADSWVLGAGLALQIRNASVRFKEIDGSSIAVSQNVGPVPALSFMAEKEFQNGIYLHWSATGSYAASALINGADFEFEGSLLDTALTGGLKMKNSTILFLSLRFLGGSATGNSEFTGRTWSESRSSYTDNRLATLSITCGVMIR